MAAAMFRPKHMFMAGAFAILAIIVSGHIYRLSRREALLEIYILSLRSGRAIFIRTADDKRYLVDAGSGTETIRDLTKLIPFYSRRIDGLFVTKPVDKNVTGLIDVLRRYRVGEVSVPGLSLGDLMAEASSTDGGEAFRQFVREASTFALKPHSLMSGDRLLLGTSASMDILFPLPKDKFRYSKSSPPELIFTVTDGTSTALFLGASTPKMQRVIASSTSVASVIVTYGNASKASISADLFKEPSHPLQKLIYSRSASSNSIARPEAQGLLQFNLKEGSIRLVFRGDSIEVQKWPLPQR